MTHDELLDRIAQEGLKPDGNVLNTKLILAFRSVVELHKPQEITLPDGEWSTGCIECDNWKYPCPTIEAIEKELG